MTKERLEYLLYQYADESISTHELAELCEVIPDPEVDDLVLQFRSWKRSIRKAPLPDPPRRQIWNAIEDDLRPQKPLAQRLSHSKDRLMDRLFPAPVIGALAAVIAVIVILIGGPMTEPDALTSWKRGTGDFLREGAVIHAQTRESISSDAVGSIALAEGTSLRLVKSDSTEHRLRLEHGTIDAVVTTPPRVFFVETPSATAVDLGCAYELHTNQNGEGRLTVTAGYVSLERDSLTSIVPAGYTCRMYASGPGTPYAVSARASLVRGVELYDSTASREAVSLILQHAGLNDAITLWHLLWTVPHELQQQVYAALEELVIPPDEVNRASIASKDPAAFQAWGVRIGIIPWF